MAPSMAKLARKYGIAAIVASEKMKNRNIPKNAFKDQMRIVFPLVSSQHSFSDFRSSMAKKGRNTDIRPSKILITSKNSKNTRKPNIIYLIRIISDN
jgi:hypothetical protein